MLTKKFIVCSNGIVEEPGYSSAFMATNRQSVIRAGAYLGEITKPKPDCPDTNFLRSKGDTIRDVPIPNNRFQWCF